MKITKSHLRKIIKEEISKVLNEDGEDGECKDDIEGFNLKNIVQCEFEAWLEEQKADGNKFQPGLGAGGNTGKAATQRSQVFYKVKEILEQEHDFIDHVEAFQKKKAGEHVPEEKVIAVGKPIYNEIYTILYDLIPRPGVDKADKNNADDRLRPGRY